MTTEEKTLHIRQAEGLRALAAMIEAHPEIPASYLESHFCVWSPTSADELAAIARAAMRHGAKVEKDIGDRHYNLKITWGGICAKALASRGEVCERVVTGMETVTKTVPDPAALAAVPTVEVTEEVEISEWVCKPLLAESST